MNPAKRRILQTHLQAGLTGLNLLMPETRQQQLLDYLRLLSQWNRIFNLTAILDLETMVGRHLLDSLAVVPYLRGQNVLDVGSGAGLPGIPLAIYAPQKHFTLVDSVGKKTRFLRHVVATLKLVNVTVVNTRIEAFKPEKLFECVISRAFSALDTFIKCTQACLLPNGQWLAMQGRLDQATLARVVQPLRVVRLNVPGLEAQRHLVIIDQGTSVALP